MEIIYGNARYKVLALIEQEDYDFKILYSKYSVDYPSKLFTFRNDSNNNYKHSSYMIILEDHPEFTGLFKAKTSNIESWYEHHKNGSSGERCNPIFEHIMRKLK